MWAIGIALLAVIAGALVSLALQGRGDDGPRGQASAGPTASTSVGSSASSSTGSGAPMASDDADPSPSGLEGESLSNLAIAAVTVSDLPLRASPGDAGEVLGQLGSAARVFVIGAPEELEDARWYRVAYVDGDYSGCDQTGCVSTIGWIPDRDDGPLIAPVAINCPGSPMTADVLAALLPLERLHCYGDATITVTGPVDYPYTGLEGPIGYDPAWLAAPITEFLFDGTQLWLRSEEPLDLEPGDVVDARLAMEHEAAPTCRTYVIEEFFTDTGQTPPPIESLVRSTPAELVLRCRTELVVESFEVVGSVPVQP